MANKRVQLKDESSDNIYPLSYADYWLFPKGTATDVLSIVSTSGATYTAPEDGVLLLRFYNGYVIIDGDDRGVASMGLTTTSTSSSQPATLRAFMKKNSTATIWIGGNNTVIISARFIRCL